MAGHSKFKNIQHRKGAQDAKRAKIFTKLGREIIVASKQGGGDPATNARLRLAIQKARGSDMPNDRIKRAIESGTGAGDVGNFEEVRYEGYGPGGVAIIVESLTDNRTRTVAIVREIFSKGGGNMGETNSVSFMFDQVGEIIYPLDKATSDQMFDAAVEAGAENAESDEESHSVTTALSDLAAVRDALEKKFGEAQRSGFVWKANVPAQVDEEQAESILKIIDRLEDEDDIQSVYTNFEVSDEIMERLAAKG
jgi:YebC/PmpR family DNA-binding regulatory protein